jgi:hypothetical protein
MYMYVGMHFGELAILAHTAGKRAATISAIVDSQMISIGRDTYRWICAAFPNEAKKHGITSASAVKASQASQASHKKEKPLPPPSAAEKLLLSPVSAKRRLGQQPKKKEPTVPAEKPALDAFWSVLEEKKQRETRTEEPSEYWEKIRASRIESDPLNSNSNSKRERRKSGLHVDMAKVNKRKPLFCCFKCRKDNKAA